MRIIITKEYKGFKRNEVMEVTPNVGFDLIDRGVAIVSKDMRSQDVSTKKGKKWRRS